MRSCEEALELMSAALDGALTGDEQAALDEHLSRCPACSALYEELRGLHAACAELEEVPAPDGFAGRVMDAIAAGSGNVASFPAKKRFRIPWKGWAATAAVVAVVALGAVALPGQLGASSSTADCAAPSLAEAGDANGAAAENYNSPRMDAVSTAPESAPDTEAVADAEPRETADGTKDAVSFAATNLPAASCGTITLTGGLLPEGLEDCEYARDETGNRTYEVPAESFFAYLQALEAEQPGGFTYDPGQEDAESGLIVVREGDAP